MTDQTDNSLITNEDMKNRLMNASSKKELEEIVSIFNLDIAKKNLMRSAVYSDLVDKVIDEMSKRVEKTPGQFSNKDLLEYMNALQAQLSKNTLENKELPNIAIQQNIVNVNSPLSDFDRDSKDRMREVLKNILSATTQGDIIEDEFTEDAYGVEGGVQSEDLPLQDAEPESADVG